MTRNCFPEFPALFIPSNASPPVIEPSPIIAATRYFSSRCLLASARPNADEIEVEAWPAPMTSYLLSALFKKPLSPLFCLMVGNSSNLPVSSLCAYPWWPTSHTSLSSGVL